MYSILLPIGYKNVVKFDKQVRNRFPAMSDTCLLILSRGFFFLLLDPVLEITHARMHVTLLPCTQNFDTYMHAYM